MPTTSSSAAAVKISGVRLLGNPAQQGAQQQATAQHDGGDHADDLEGLQQHARCRRVASPLPRGCAQPSRAAAPGWGWPPRPGTAGSKTRLARCWCAAGCARPAPAAQWRWTTAPAPAPPPAPRARAARPASPAQTAAAAQPSTCALPQCQRWGGAGPQAAGLQLQPHQKQHQHHAKLGKVQDVLHIAHQPRPQGPMAMPAAR
jgi:hypothetical protein